MKYFLIFLLLILTTNPVFPQSVTQVKASIPGARPKLIVGIVVDQMRYDYIYKYWDKLGKGGFKRLLGEGFNCRNAQFNYMPTYTGPGHASIYTGTTPSVHGIISNTWFNKFSLKNTYCTEDENTKPLGGSALHGKMSPKNMLSTTFCDELRLFSNMSSRVFAVSLKDRGAILPAGHSANAAYWFDPTTGYWMTSTHYMDKLPEWVELENKKEYVRAYLSADWNTLLPIEQYTESAPDDNPYEIPFSSEVKPVFPHKLKEISLKAGPGVIRATPFGNTLTKDFALEIIRNEKLGKGTATDMLAISFSSPDFIGHQFGPQSVEVEDCYLRLDKDIADFLSFLDSWLGKTNVLVFLTADHAAVDVPSYMISKKIPGGYYDESIIQDSLRKWSLKKYGDTIVSSVSNFQVFLDHKRMEKKKIDRVEAENQIALWLQKLPGMAEVVTSTVMRSTSFTTKPFTLMQAGFHPVRSGDVLFNLQPGWIEYDKRGTTHGSPWSYDTRVPLIWYGWKVNRGETLELVNIIDIAPTICAALNINFPNGCTGKPIPLIIK